MAQFDPDTLSKLRIALEAAHSALPRGLQTQNEKLILAERILKLAAEGERDPLRLQRLALTERAA